MSQELERLAGVDVQALGSTLDQLVTNVSMLLGVPSVSVALLEPETGDLVTWAALGSGSEGRRGTRFRPNEGIAGWVAAHLEPVVVNDITREPRYKPLGDTSIRSMLCVPLIDQDQLLGTLTVSSTEYAAFDLHRQRLLQVFSDQAVLAISKTRQAEAAKAQARELGALLDASRALTSSLEPSQVFAYIVASTRKVISCDDVVIYAYEEHTDSLRVVTGLGTRIERLGGAEVPIEDTHSIAAWVARHRRARVSVPGRGEIGPVTEAFLAGDELAILCVPLVSKGRLRGVIMLARDQAFLPGELGAMLNLSNIVAATLENAELYQTARAEREQQAAIYAAASDAITLVDAQLTLVEANDAFAHLAGRPRDSLLGMRYCEALGLHDVAPGDMCATERLLVDALHTGQLVPFIESELPVTHFSPATSSQSRPRVPKRRFVDFSVTPVHSPQGRRLLLVGRDVTSAREMDQLKANFLAMVTHELRSPLHIINNHLDVVLSGEISDPLTFEQAKLVRRARAASERQTALVDDLLLISRRDAGQFSLNLRDIEISHIIPETAQELEVVAEDVGVRLTMDVPPMLPLVRTDGIRIAQVVRNLLTNAIKFTPAGGVVAVSTESTPDRLLIHVRDTGVGIAPQHLDHIFDRFYQVGGTSPHGRAHGQGLGLAIVRIIVESHGGTIQVRSAPGQGSTFTISLPLAPSTSLPGTSLPGAE
jgi:signal transduction histidine kinase/GAF domain-containing protein